jgi:hypothetical protein
MIASFPPLGQVSARPEALLRGGYQNLAPASVYS